MKNAAWENWINLVLGIWVMLTPWVLPLPSEAARLSIVISDSLAGAVVFGSAALALQELSVAEELTGLVMGVWIFLSPWVLGFAGDGVALWNCLLAGALIAGVSSLALPIARSLRRREEGR